MPKTSSKTIGTRLLASPIKTKKSILITIIALLSVIGIAYVVITRAGGAGSSATYSVIATYAEDGKTIRTDINQCRQYRDICHSNGKFVVETICSEIGMTPGIVAKALAGGCGPSPMWQSDPAYNNNPTNFTWFGPFIPHGPSGLGNGFNGYQACFSVYDKKINNTGAVVYFDVAASGKVIASTSSQLTRTPSIVCLPYDVQGTQYLQYRARVISGVIQIQNVSVEKMVDLIAPSVPTSLTATATSSSQVKLTWTAAVDNVGVTQYQVWRNNQIIGSSTTPAYYDNTVVANNSYNYVVVAMDAAGNLSGASNTATATPRSSGTTGGVE